MPNSRKTMAPGTVFSIMVLGEELRATVIKDNGHDIDVFTTDDSGAKCVEKWPDDYDITIISEPGAPDEAILANTLRDIGQWIDNYVDPKTVDGAIFHRRQIQEALNITGFGG